MENSTSAGGQGKTNHAKTTFLYLLSLVALIFVAISSGIAIFQIINKYIVDFANSWGMRYSDDALKFAISSLIIATPVYYMTVKFINKEIAQKRLNNDYGIRKWLTYFILLVSSIIILVWLIVTLNRFFEGELTGKSILKTLTILTICGRIFSFYLYDIKRNLDAPKSTGVAIFFYSSLAAILITLIASFFTIDPPSLTRNYRADGQTINKLNNVYYAIDDFYRNENDVPNSINELLAQKTYPLAEDDIINTGADKKIEYTRISNTEYTLCTDFLADTAENDQYYYEGNSARWNHEKGYKCFELEVTKAQTPKQLDAIR